MHLTWWTYTASANLNQHFFRHTWLNTAKKKLNSDSSTYHDFQHKILELSK